MALAQYRLPVLGRRSGLLGRVRVKGYSGVLGIA